MLGVALTNPAALSPTVTIKLAKVPVVPAAPKLISARYRPGAKPVGFTETDTEAGVVAEAEGTVGVTLTFSIGLLVTIVGVSVVLAVAVVEIARSLLCGDVDPLAKSKTRLSGAAVRVLRFCPVTVRVTGIAAVEMAPLLICMMPP